MLNFTLLLRLSLKIGWFAVQKSQTFSRIGRRQGKYLFIFFIRGLNFMNFPVILKWLLWWHCTCFWFLWFQDVAFVQKREIQKGGFILEYRGSWWAGLRERDGSKRCQAHSAFFLLWKPVLVSRALFCIVHTRLFWHYALKDYAATFLVLRRWKKHPIRDLLAKQGVALHRLSIIICYCPGVPNHQVQGQTRRRPVIYRIRSATYVGFHRSKEISCPERLCQSFLCWTWGFPTN